MNISTVEKTETHRTYFDPIFTPVEELYPAYVRENRVSRVVLDVVSDNGRELWFLEGEKRTGREKNENFIIQLKFSHIIYNSTSSFLYSSYVIAYKLCLQGTK